MSREDAYRLVRRNAMRVSDGALSPMELLKAEPEVAAVLATEEIEARFDLDNHYKHAAMIFYQR